MSLHHVQDRYPDLYHQLVTWRDDLIALLGENLVAVYVMGSLFMGDFAEASSDVDFLVVTVHPPTQEGVEQLARLHMRLGDISPWGARLEGAYAAESALRPWGIDGTVVAIEPGGPLCEGPSEYSADNMLALRDHSMTLYGPPASRVVPPIDRATLEQGLRAYLDDLIERARACTGTRRGGLMAVEHRALPFWPTDRSALYENGGSAMACRTRSRATTGAGGRSRRAAGRTQSRSG